MAPYSLRRALLLTRDKRIYIESRALSMLDAAVVFPFVSDEIWGALVCSIGFN